MVRTTTALTTTALLMASSSAFAYVNTMYNVPFEPSSIGDQIASLDSSGYDYQANVNGSGPGGPLTSSGFSWEITDGNDMVLLSSTTTLVSTVFSVNTPTTLTDSSGDIDLSVGDLIFAYTLTLVDANIGAVESVTDFNIGAITVAVPTNPVGPNSALFNEDIVIGRGFTTSGLTNPTANAPEAAPNDLSTGSPVLSGLDWSFPDTQPLQLQNSESITFLMFTRPALVEPGVSGFVGNPGEAAGSVDDTANFVPVLVPVVPAPGALALLGAATVGLVRRRRA